MVSSPGAKLVGEPGTAGPCGDRMFDRVETILLMLPSNLKPLCLVPTGAWPTDGIDGLRYQ